MKVSTADFIKNYGTLADKALTEPVTITKNGRDRLVLVAVEEYERLKRRDRRVFGAGELPDEIVEAIAQKEMDPRHEHLNDLVKDWQP